jgi:hypothetical protein
LPRPKAREANQRSMILQSLFGTQRGSANFDWQDVGPRFLEPIPDGKYKGFTIAKWLPDLIFEYYRYRAATSERADRSRTPWKNSRWKNSHRGAKKPVGFEGDQFRGHLTTWSVLE